MKFTPLLNLNLPESTDYVNIEDINENMVAIDEHLTDFEYQVPTVIGKQLQLVKKSTSKRLFIKMANDLSGPITVSLDNGVSSKPLVDANGEAVNQLEKGLAEVVEDTSFFTLRSRGITSTDLQALIAIVNEAEANESDLKTQFARAVNAVDVDGGINLPDGAAWAEILAQVPNIKTGKKWASGSLVSSNDLKNFSNSGGTNRQQPYLIFDASSLDFVPSVINYIASNKSQGVPYVWFDTNYYYSSANNYGNCYADFAYRVPYVATVFYLPVATGNKSFQWVAYE